MTTLLALLALLAYAATIALAYAIYRALCLINWRHLGVAYGMYEVSREDRGRIAAALTVATVITVSAIGLVVAETAQRSTLTGQS